jgi:hypothetical protein
MVGVDLQDEKRAHEDADEARTADVEACSVVGGPPSEPQSLENRIVRALRWLPAMRTLPSDQLHALATDLRVLSNVAEGFARRKEHPAPDEKG